MLSLKNTLLNSLIDRLAELAAHEECAPIRQAYIEELHRVEVLLAAKPARICAGVSSAGYKAA